MDRIVHCARECNLKNPTDLVKECLIACDPLLRHYGKEPDVSLPSWAAILIAACLVPLSALFSGLTLGLLSLDPMALKVCWVFVFHTTLLVVSIPTHGVHRLWHKQAQSMSSAMHGASCQVLCV